MEQNYFIDVVSPEVMDLIKGEEKKTMDNLLKFQGIKSITPDVFFEELLPQMKKEKQSKFKKEYRDFYNDYKRKFKGNIIPKLSINIIYRVNSIRKQGNFLV